MSYLERRILSALPERPHLCGAKVRLNYVRTETGNGGKWSIQFFNDNGNQISCCPGCGRTLDINEMG